jgi:hypothetical protein
MEPLEYNPLSLQEAVILSILAIFFIISIFNVKKLKRDRLVITYYVILAFYLLWQISATLLADNILISLTSLLIHDRYIILCFIAPILINNDILEKYMLALLIFPGIIIVIKAIYDMLPNISMLFNLFMGGKFYRQAVIFENPNNLATYILVCLLLALFYIDKYIKKRKHKIFLYIVTGPPQLFILLMTFSRRAWAAFAFAVGLLFVLDIKKYKILVPLFTIVLLLIVSIDYNSILFRITSISDKYYPGARVGALNNIIGYALKDKTLIFTGFGVGSYGQAAAYFNKGMLIDSYLLLNYIEFGLMGLMFYLMLMAIAVYMGVRSILLYKECGSLNKDNSAAYVIILLMLLLISTVGTNLNFPINMMQWLFIGLIIRHYTLSLDLKKKQLKLHN